MNSANKSPIAFILQAPSRNVAGMSITFTRQSFDALLSAPHATLRLVISQDGFVEVVVNGTLEPVIMRFPDIKCVIANCRSQSYLDVWVPMMSGFPKLYSAIRAAWSNSL